MWPAFLRALAITTVATLALLAAFVVLMNPYGNLPLQAFGGHVITDGNQRYQYPSIIRSHRFDSVVVGTSSARLLDPADLDRAFGGRFANLAMDDGRAWEQAELARLFLSETAKPKTMLFALDWVWCAGDADTARVTKRGFPEWMFDADPWNDWLYVLNLKALEIAGRQFAVRLGLGTPGFTPSGFDVFTPPDATYDPAKARAYIWQGRRRDEAPAKPYVPTEIERTGWTYPALAWLDALLAKAQSAERRILAFMPSHIAAQPLPGSREAAREAECKSRVASLGLRHDAYVVDFRVPSPITREDANYWDRLHYREAIAKRIVSGIGNAVLTRADDPSGDWRYLRPR